MMLSITSATFSDGGVPMKAPKIRSSRQLKMACRTVMTPAKM